MGGKNSEGINPTNVIPFLILGCLANILYRAGYNAFDTKFLAEKFWHTIEATLISPINKISILFGVFFVEMMRIILFIIGGIGIALLFYPTATYKAAIVLLILLLLGLMTIGIGLVKAGFILANENMLAFFQYFNYLIMFLSCFYYPIEALPSWIHPLVILNPVYHGTTIIRDVWFGNPFSMLSFLFVFLTALSSLIFGTLLFSLTWRKLGITG